MFMSGGAKASIQKGPLLKQRGRGMTFRRCCASMVAIFLGTKWKKIRKGGGEAEIC